MKFLANDYVKVFDSTDPAHIFAYTPGICTLPGGRLVVTMDEGRKSDGKFDNSLGHAYLSDDHGFTWRKVVDFPFIHARPFVAGNSVYILGHLGDLRIIRSDDNGETWSSFTQLTQGQSWHQSASNVWYREDRIYMVMEQTNLKEGDLHNTWGVSYCAPIMLRANIHEDLCKWENWTTSTPVRFNELVPEGKLDYHGIPFYKTLFHSEELIGEEHLAQPLGWLETNVVQIMDEKHYWYDETGHTFQLFMRAHTAGTGYCAIAKVIEQPDGTMKFNLMKAPSGRKWVFLPMPGGQMRFHMLYDEKTKLYWLLSTQATDSMTRKELLSGERYNIPCDERQRLTLHFSKNCVDWCFAGIVTAGDSEKQSRHYAAMAFDEEDIVLVSRSGDERASSAHNVNFISFHRIKNFRDLVY